MIRVLVAVLVACVVVSAVAGDEGDGEVVDGCYFYHGEQVGCLKVNIFTCDNLWDFQLTRTVGDAQLIVDSGMNRFGPDTAFSCFSDMGCTECILFEHIRLEGNAMTTDVTYSKQCAGQIIHVSFGTFYAKGASCGAPGYFYVPCTRRGLFEDDHDEKTVGQDYDAPEVQSVLSLRDDSIVANSFLSASRSRDADDDFWFLGTDGCVYVLVPSGYSNEGDYILLTCPIAAMDTCSSDTDLVSSAGVLYHFPIFEDEDTSQCVSISTDLDACLFVTNARYDDNSVRANLHMTLNAYGGEIAALPMGIFLWEFPHCGDSLEQCALIPTFSESGFVDSILLPHSPTISSFHSASLWSTTPLHISYFQSSPGHSPRHHSPHDSSSSGVDQTNVWIGVLVASVVLFVCVALIAAVVAGLAVIKQREERGENLYNLFLGDDEGQGIPSVGEAADPDSNELLTH